MQNTIIISLTSADTNAALSAFSFPLFYSSQILHKCPRNICARFEGMVKHTRSTHGTAGLRAFCSPSL